MQEIKVMHVLPCILKTLAGSHRKLFEHKAPRLSIKASSEGPGKC